MQNSYLTQNLGRNCEKNTDSEYNVTGISSKLPKLLF